MQLNDYQKRVWAVIDIDAVKHNFNLVPKPICCVVKANAYGHGAVRLSKIFEQMDASYLAVSNIEEGIQLRENGISIPIIILGYTNPNNADLLTKFDLTQCLYTLDFARELSNKATCLGKKIKCHLKIDTGMGRIGFQFHDGTDELNEAYLASILPGINVEGIFTHFAIADEGINSFTIKQNNCFKEAIDRLEKKGLYFKYKHCSNSAALIEYPDFHMDMVRAGIILYGFNPTPQKSINLRPVLSLWSVVSNVKTIKKGDSVSYGRTFIADKDTNVVTVPIGYADGFWRSNSGNNVFINGHFCKIIGRVCMDQIMVLCDNASIGDLVEIYGPHITIENVAKYNNTIPYEILCSIGERVPRIYIEKGKVVDIRDNILQ